MRLNLSSYVLKFLIGALLASCLLYRFASAQESTNSSPSIVVHEVQGIGVTAETKAELTAKIRHRLESLLPLTENRYQLATTLQALGSTFSVTLKLSDRLHRGQQPLTVRETGKRSSRTFEEVTQLALEKMIRLAKLDEPARPVLTQESPANISPITAITPVATTVSYQPKQYERKKSWYQEWWIWTIIGGVAAGATTVAIIGLDGGGNDSTADADQNNGGNNGGSGSGGNTSTIQTVINLK